MEAQICSPHPGIHPPVSSSSSQAGSNCGAPMEKTGRFAIDDRAHCGTAADYNTRPPRGGNYLQLKSPVSNDLRALNTLT